MGDFDGKVALPEHAAATCSWLDAAFNNVGFDVANAVLWLCSDKSSFATWVGLCVDGGCAAR